MCSFDRVVNEDPSRRCHLLLLSHDELGVIFDGLADPLQPGVAVALSSTCLGLRTPLQAALEVLKERHEKAKALCRKLDKSCAQVRGAERLRGRSRLVADDMATLGMILCTNGLPRLLQLYLGSCYGFGDADVQALCEGLGRGAAPSLRILSLADSKLGPAGAEALATALGRGAMPKLEELELTSNPIGNQGVASLTASLRKMSGLKRLYLGHCEIGDEGVASLVDNLGKDDFKALVTLFLQDNKITDVGCTKLVSALSAGALLAIEEFYYQDDDDVEEEGAVISEHASKEACAAVRAALQKRRDAKQE